MVFRSGLKKVGGRVYALGDFVDIPREDWFAPVEQQVQASPRGIFMNR